MSAEAPFLGQGFAFPPSFGAGGADVEMVSGAADIHQALQILLGTMPGERVMEEAFGCDLMRFLFEELDQGFINRVERLIKAAILEYEARIDLEQIKVERSPEEAGCAVISIRYKVRGTNSRFNLVFPFYLTEASLSGV